ncbi:aminopeptidase N, partial [Aphis craccivora]
MPGRRSRGFGPTNAVDVLVRCGRSTMEHLTYAGAAWAPFISKSTWSRIEAVQTIGIRTILGQPTFVRNQILLNTVSFNCLRDEIKKNAK